MKFTGKSNPTGTLPITTPNLRSSHRRATIRSRKLKPGLTRHRRSAVSGRRRRSKPETPPLKLAAGVRRFQGPNGGDVLGFQESVDHAGHMSSLFLNHLDDKHFGMESNNLRKCGFLHKHEPLIPFPHCAMEGATKWDHIFLDTRDGYSNVKMFDQQVNAGSSASYIELKLEEARARIEDLVGEKRSQKKKIEHFLRKVSEERVVWRSREHEKVRAIIDDMKAEMNEEKKTRRRLETVNKNLVNELADSKLAVKRYMHNYQKERKARELIEKVCDELAKEIEEDKAEIEALKSESMNIREEVDDERRMLQMAEVWREERVHMKLIDAKVTLEDKYSQMNNLVEDLEAFLKSRNATTGVIDIRGAELLRKTAASVDHVQEIKEFTYEPANPDDLFMLFEEMNLGDTQDREIEQYVAYSPVSHTSKVHRHSNAFNDQNGQFDEDDSGWDTESQSEEHGSSYSPDESIHRISNSHRRDSNVSMNGPEFQKTPLREIKEVCSVPRRQSKKVSSMAKLWSSLEGINGKVSNGRKSTVGMTSPERDTSKGGFSSLDLVGKWSSSPDSAYVNRGGMKGCIEWPRGAHKNSLKTKLIEAQIETQKVQLKHVLEHKI